MKINSLASDKPSTKIYDRTVIDRCLPKVYMSHFLHLALLSVFSFGSANVYFYLSLVYCVHVSVHVNSLIQPRGKAYNVCDLLTPLVLYVSFYASG